jgi:hypothetical protein
LSMYYPPDIIAFIMETPKMTDIYCMSLFSQNE